MYFKNAIEKAKQNGELTKDKTIIEATRQLLDKEGIFAGLSSGTVVHQATKVASEMDEGNIVVVLADGGWKYLSLDFWNKAI